MPSHRRQRCRALAALVVAGLVAAGCGRGQAATPVSDAAASVQRVEGSTQLAVHLSARAAQRLGIETDTVHGALVPPRPAAPSASPAVVSTAPVLAKVVRFAAVLYLPSGEAYLYTNPRPLEYVRQPLVVDYVTGDLAVLTSGPDLATRVVTVGATELSGVEFGAGE
ncbi:MAG: hypothetical protein JWN46_3741 [Acidimicrobiales bacterium]|nr:hypothetical protein [Acidimicrobiales bacterium]